MPNSAICSRRCFEDRKGRHEIEARRGKTNQRIELPYMVPSFHLRNIATTTMALTAATPSALRRYTATTLRSGRPWKKNPRGERDVPFISALREATATQPYLPTYIRGNNFEEPTSIGGDRGERAAAYLIEKDVLGSVSIFPSLLPHQRAIGEVTRKQIITNQNTS